MSQVCDPRLNEAKHKSVAQVLAQLKIAGLRQTPNKREMTGPCPVCGTTGHNPKSGPPDRFNINLQSGAFFCRRCQIRGGDVIALVREVNGGSFRDALTFLCGETPKDETPEQRRAREKRQREVARQVEREAAARERQAQGYRMRAIKDARGMWSRSRPGHLGVVGAYLKARGIAPELLPEIPRALRFLLDHPYVKKIDGRFETLHRGPCMIAGVLNPRDELTAVHQTWVDLDPPHGKAKITWNGETFKSKLVRGRSKGCAIRLHTPPGADTLVMGEGIETTLSAMVARPYENAAYWAGIDLGKMAGKMVRVPGKRYSGLPDMTDDEAFVPPPWVRLLVFVMDGDSDPVMTRAKLECGLKRAMACVPGLRTKIVNPGMGVDLNDVLVADTS